jgi:hypothetical protein
MKNVTKIQKLVTKSGPTKMKIIAEKLRTACNILICERLPG